MSTIVAVHGNTPFISAYPWSVSGFGAKYSDPATALPGTGRAVAFSADGEAVAATHDGSPFISAYPWSGAGFGAKYSNPATALPGAGLGVVFSPAEVFSATPVASHPHHPTHPTLI